MRVLLIGNTGQVGWELERTLAPLGEVIAVDYPAMDLANPDSICTHVRSVQPQAIVNAAAYMAVNKAETEPELAFAINGAAPGILAEEAKASGAVLIHYSTDYVFDGQKGEPYIETDTPNHINTYGKSKLRADRLAAAGVGAGRLVGHATGERVPTKDCTGKLIVFPFVCGRAFVRMNVPWKKEYIGRLAD